MNETKPTPRTLETFELRRKLADQRALQHLIDRLLETQVAAEGRRVAPKL